MVEHRAGASGIRRAEGDVAAVPGPVRGRRAVARERARSIWCGGTRSRARFTQERLSRVFYENYIGSIIDWYAATLMRREPVLAIRGAATRRRRSFYSLLAEDCDLKGHAPDASSSGSGSCETLVCGSELHGGGFSAGGRGGADAGGRRRDGALAGVSGGLRRRRKSSTGIYDRRGGLEWAVIRTSSLRQVEGRRTASGSGRRGGSTTTAKTSRSTGRAGESGRDRADGRGTARAGEAEPGAGVRVDESRKGCG